MEASKSCFVIMPFSQTSKKHTKSYWDNHFNNYLKPLIDSCSQVQARRSTPLREDILRQIINDLAFSPVVVADLTDSNPNVYWELGVRLSFRHGTITIAEESSNVPFDLNTKGFIFYPSEPAQRTEFAVKFKEAVNDCISNPNRPDSIVLETITGRGSIYSVIHRQEILNRLDGLIAENNFNALILEEAKKAAFRNKSRLLPSLRTKYNLIFTQLGNSALNLLLAEHYIEAEKDFYEYAHTMLICINSINERLSAWSSNSDIGKWFLDDEFYNSDLFTKYQKRLEKIKEEMLRKC